LSDDNTMRIWRLNRRLTAREPHEITGYSERTHREIGNFNVLTLKLSKHFESVNGRTNGLHSMSGGIITHTYIYIYIYIYMTFFVNLNGRMTIFYNIF
jgi:hypothetical protein